MLQVVCCISLMLHLLPCTALLMLFCLGAMCKLCLQQLLSLQSPALRICAGRICLTARLLASPPERPAMQVLVQRLLCRPFRCCSSRFCCCTSAHCRICCYLQKDSHLNLTPIDILVLLQNIDFLHCYFLPFSAGYGSALPDLHIKQKRPVLYKLTFSFISFNRYQQSSEGSY